MPGWKNTAKRGGIATVATLVAGVSIAADWPTWRGPSRNGVVAESSGWDGTSWIAESPAWETSVGEGAASPLVVGDRVYVLGWARDRDTLRCLDASTGTVVWSVDDPAPRYGRFATGDEGFYSGPSSTPEHDGETGLIYTLGIDGDLRCRDTRANGQLVWQTNLYDTFQVKRRPKVGRAGLRDYGYTSSPLVHRSWLLVEAGAPEGNVIAFDKLTGRQVWASENKDPAGHNAGPAPIDVGGTPCVAVLTTHGLAITRLDAARAGRLVAHYPWVTDFANNIASAAVHGDSVLITSEYNHGTMCRLRVSLEGIEKLWEVEHPSKVCTPVVHKGHVYFAWRQAQCLDWETGKRKWAGGSFRDAGSCIVTGDDRLIVYGENGRLALVETAVRSPDRYVELASRRSLFREDAWPHVALSNGRVYCRDRLGKLVAFAVQNAR